MVAAVVAVAAAMQNPVEAVEAVVVVVEAFVAAADSNSTKCAANMTPSAVVMSGRRIDSSGTVVSEATVSEEEEDGAEDAGRRTREQEELGGPIRADKGSRIGVSACDQKISGRESRLMKFFPALNFWHRYGSWEGFCRGIYI